MKSLLSSRNLLLLAFVLVLAALVHAGVVDTDKGGLIGFAGVYAFPEGATFNFANTFASAINITALSNANPAVATSTAHGLSTGDEILLTSGWEDATQSVYQVTVIDANSFSIKGLNTSNTQFYAAGAGVGTAQKISGWTAIPQVLSISTSGGDPRFTTISPLAKRNSINVPTGFNPTTITLSLGHDPSNAAYQTMLGIARGLTTVAFKLALSGGGTSYGYGYMSVNETPSLNVNQANTVSSAFTLLGRSISY